MERNGTTVQIFLPRKIIALRKLRAGSTVRRLRRVPFTGTRGPGQDAAEVIERAGRFPKNLRPTLGNRLIDRTLEVLDHVVALRYTKERGPLSRKANLSLEQLRVLIRLCFEKRLVSKGQYKELAESVDTCGRMLEGWRKAQEGKEA